MIIHPVDVVTDDGRVRVQATVELEDAGNVFPKTGLPTHEIWIDWPEEYAPPSPDSADGFFVTCLPVAMRLGERLKVCNEVSQSLLVNALEAMEVFRHYWGSYCTVVPIEASCRTREKSGSGRVASFYSGGIDSLYNIAEHFRLNAEYGVTRVSDLWLIQGMDIPLSNLALWEDTKSRTFEQLRPEDGMRFVDIRTNFRDIQLEIVGWDEMGFGPVLGGIAKTFAAQIPTVLIGSYGTYDEIRPHASSPLLDPLWSCDQQTVRHFSSRVSRQQKVTSIAEHAPHLLKALRVCHENRGGAYNCGVCEKCMRTQAQLLIAGHRDLVSSFDHVMTPDDVRKLRLPWQRRKQHAWDFWRDIRREMEEKGFIEYRSAIDHALRRQSVRKYLKQARRKG